jgi:hypothetical protein
MDDFHRFQLLGSYLSRGAISLTDAFMTRYCLTTAFVVGRLQEATGRLLVMANLSPQNSDPKELS